MPEPTVEQSRLQRVHVLELIDGECGEPRSDGVGGIGMLVEEPHREPQHVLEIEAADRGLAALVPLVDPEHQLRRDRRRVVAEFGKVADRRDHAVLGPFDLVRELASRKELVWRRQGVRERRDQWGLVIQHLGERLTSVQGPQS